ncbi:MarR family transcriptional regulator [Brevibacillus laterosporus]|uniref:MarR family transcriptional regulator n=1 Tax=Brevibacillus laterosporus TaxID=1465 RepID=UPI001EF348AA|nr:helix-turn-helix domain-containing protein [Brevibacillus laterosporus]MCG7317663.1 MarR family transcriptional regulator [Brevibacillus laterosporus]
MNDYFNEVVNALTHEDFQVLGYLSDEDATASFKAKNKNNITDITNFSSAVLRRIINRLIACRLIEISTMANGKRSYYLSKYGTQAINKSLKGAVE